MTYLPLSISQYIERHMDSNPTENEYALRMKIQQLMNDYKGGVKCTCGNDLWVVGSIQEEKGCYTCLTGKPHPAGEPEIEEALNKTSKEGQKHIDEMDPRMICGIFDDDGNQINPDLIKKPSLCLTCIWDEDDFESYLCDLNRFGQREDREFKCYQYDKRIP